MYRPLRPLLFRLDAERAHRIAIRAGRILQKLPSRHRSDPAGLGQTLFGVRFPNPVGIAAGLDKNAECIPYWEKIGCGFIEVGSVSADPAPGNPKPRAFRLPLDRALVNRMGLNNDGADAVGRRIRRIAATRRVPLGINIVKTNRAGLEGVAAIEDFCRSFLSLAALADYISLNVSCPNTDDGKTFEDPAPFDALLDGLVAASVENDLEVPILVKFSPPEPGELSSGGRFHELVAIAEAHEVNGYIATNTTLSRDELRTDPSVVNAIGRGGLSGRPLAKASRQLLRYLYREIGQAKPVISVGGIDTTDEVVSRIYMGASLVQIYTGLVYEGPGLIRTIVDGISSRFEADGVSDIGSAVGRLA